MREPDTDSLRHLLFSLDGRVTRRTWWCWAVAMPIGLGLYLSVVLRVAGLSASNTEAAVNLLLFWPVLAVSAKRWHDRGRSGWWVLVLLVPLIGWLWALIENGLRRGDADANRFGAPPADA